MLIIYYVNYRIYASELIWIELVIAIEIQPGRGVSDGICTLHSHFTSGMSGQGTSGNIQL